MRLLLLAQVCVCAVSDDVQRPSRVLRRQAQAPSMAEKGGFCQCPSETLPMQSIAPLNPKFTRTYILHTHITHTHTLSHTHSLSHTLSHTHTHIVQKLGELCAWAMLRAGPRTLPFNMRVLRCFTDPPLVYKFSTHTHTHTHTHTPVIRQ